MIEQNESVLEPILQTAPVSRRSLLPMWMKVFTWIFLISGSLGALAFLLMPFGISFEFSIYGIEATEPSLFYFLVITIFVLKGVVALGLWTEKDWAITLGILDAWLGIMLCCAVMFVFPIVFAQNGFAFTFRLELAVLIAYLIQLNKLRRVW